MQGGEQEATPPTSTSGAQPTSGAQQQRPVLRFASRGGVPDAPNPNTTRVVEGPVEAFAQRMEKEGLKLGLATLITEYGLPISDVCTDQCRGAPGDIATVLKSTTVQRLLLALPVRLCAWVAAQLGGGGESVLRVERGRSHFFEAGEDLVHATYALLERAQASQAVA